MLEYLIKLEPKSQISLQLQLRKQIAQAIMRGNFPINKPLPSSRKLSKELHIARNTVVLAYEHLEDDGYLVAKERRGYFVNPEILKGRAKAEATSPEEITNKPNWSSLIKIKQSGERHITKPSDWQKYRYPFIYGQFDPSLFPTYNWRECCRDSISQGGIREWASDRVVLDDPALINEIRTRILPRRGIWVDEEQIMVTVGTQQGLYILTKLLLDQNSLLGVENPGYTDIRRIAALNQVPVRPLAIDQQGLVISEQATECDVLFITPSHQAPTTVTMPLERRQNLLKEASEHDFLIIEDDYEAETNFATEHTPALKSLDAEERVIYTGSFSKTLAPGLRLGYVVGSKEVIQEAIALRRLMVRHPPANNQRAVALFIHRGYYDALAAKILKAYEARWQTMASALETYLPQSATPPTFGGSSYWVEGPEKLDARELQQLALENSLILEAGDIHFSGQNIPKNFFRLGYSSIKSEKIHDGIKLLSELIARLS